MTTEAVVHDSFTIERTYRAAPHRVFAAFADPAQKRVWFVEGENWTVLSFDVDFREGGTERSRFRFKDGPEMSNETFYHQIVPNRRIVSSYSMALGANKFSVSLTTVEIEPDGSGSRVKFTEQGAFLEGADGVERRRAGWTELLQRLEAGLAAASGAP